MTRSSLLSLFLAAILMPSVVLAAVPSNVTGLSAEMEEDGSIFVRWDPLPAEENVASYHVYFSQRSILENEGNYDDYESTVGPISEYTFRVIPQTASALTFAVTAINASGEESESFVEEVSVDLTNRPPSTIPPAAETPPEFNTPPAELPPPPAAEQTEPNPTPPEVVTSPPSPAQGATLRLLSAKAFSATQVFLEFSATPTISAEDAPRAFSIVDPSERTLPIDQLTIDGPQVTIQTQRQEAGIAYQVRLSDPLRGEGDLPLDLSDRVAFFTGHITGTIPMEQTGPVGGAESPATSIPALPEGTLPDVVNFTLQAYPEADHRRFTIVGQWQYDPRTPPSAFVVVRQSTDGGRTFGDPESLPLTMEGVRIAHIDPQSFGIAVYVVDPQGHASAGVFRSVFSQETSPLGALSPTTLTATITPLATPPRGGPLSQTGIGMGVVFMTAAGGFFGWRRARRKK